MHIRTAILLTGTALAIVAPSATAGIPWEPTGHPAHTSTYNGVNRYAFHGTAVVPATENSYGQSKSTSTINTVKLPKAKKTAQTSTSHVVTMIVEPMLPATGVAAAPDPGACRARGASAPTSSSASCGA